MQAMSTSSAHTSTRVRVGVICHGAQLPPAFIEKLEREVIEATPVHSTTFGKTLDVDILLLWLSPGTPASLVRDMSSWIKAREAKVGLIGCAPNGDIEDTIAAFEAGADDFVAGRCGVRELASRIHSLRLRLDNPQPEPDYSTQGLKLDALSHEIRRGHRTIRLSPTEVSVMKVLLDEAGRVLSRSTILDRAWGDRNFEVGERAVDNVILRLRRKLGEPQLIETVRGVGFRLASD